MGAGVFLCGGEGRVYDEGHVGGVVGGMHMCGSAALDRAMAGGVGAARGVESPKTLLAGPGHPFVSTTSVLPCLGTHNCMCISLSGNTSIYVCFQFW